MKPLAFLIALCLFISAHAQQYNPADQNPINKPWGQAQDVPLDARNYYYDKTLFKYRPFQSVQEANNFFKSSVNRSGHFSVYINIGGTLNANGKFTGGHVYEFWYRDGVADSSLVPKEVTAAAQTIDEMKSTSVINSVLLNRDSVRGGSFNLVYSANIMDDDGINFAATGIGANWHWVRDMTNTTEVNVKWFGVKGDGVQDASQILQSIINLIAGNSTIREIHFPSGNYGLSNTLKIKSGIVLTGGKKTVISPLSGFVGTSVIEADTVKDFTLSNLNIQVGYKTRFGILIDPNSEGVHLSNLYISKSKYHGGYLRGKNIFLEYCTFDSCGIADSAVYANSAGIFTSGAVNLNVDHCIFKNSRQHGVYSLGLDTGYTNITYCDAYNNGGAGLSIRTMAGRIIGNHLFGNTLRGLYLNNEIETPKYASQQVVASENIIHDNLGVTDDVLISGVDNLIFANNTIKSNGISAYALKVNKCTSCNITTNDIVGGTSGCIALFDTVSNLIMNNNLLDGSAGSGVILYKSGSAIPLLNVAQFQNNQFFGGLSIGLNFQAAAVYNDILLQGNWYIGVANKFSNLGTGTNVQNKDDALQRKAISATYKISPSDRYIAITATSLLDSIYLPFADSVPMGTEIIITDESGSINNTTRPLIIASQNSNLINGSASQVITEPYSYLRFISNGVSKWIFRNRTAPTRFAWSNANYTISPYQSYVALTSIISSKVFTLPPANSVMGGKELIIADESGALSSTIKLTIAAAGSDLINGATTEDITSPYGFRRLISDGVDKWFFDGGIVRINQTQTLTNKSMSGTNNTFTAIPESAITNLITDLAGKQATLVSGTNIKTINGVSVLGSGDISTGGGSSLGYLLPVATTASQSPVDGATLFIGTNSATVLGTSGSNKIYIAKTGIITHVSFFAAIVTAAGTAEAASLYVRVNNTTDYLVSNSITLDANQQEFHNNSLNIPVTGDYMDYIEYKLVCPTWTTNPVGVRMTIQAQVE